MKDLLRRELSKTLLRMMEREIDSKDYGEDVLEIDVRVPVQVSLDANNKVKVEGIHFSTLDAIFEEALNNIFSEDYEEKILNYMVSRMATACLNSFGCRTCRFSKICKGIYEDGEFDFALNDDNHEFLKAKIKEILED